MSLKNRIEVAYLIMDDGPTPKRPDASIADLPAPGYAFEATELPASTPLDAATVPAQDEPVFEIEYTPRVSLGVGWKALRELAASLLLSRELIWQLLRRDITARYRQSALGYVWAVAPSLATVMTFVLLSRSRILEIGPTGLPYPLFVILGLTVWQVFAEGVSRMTTSLSGSGNLISKVNFPREALVIAAMGEVLFDTLIRSSLVAILFAYYGLAPGWTAIFIPLVLAPLVLLALGVGFLTAPINAVVRDLANALTLVLTFAMLLTPVVYPPPTSWPASLINYANPVSPFIIAVRDLAVGRAPSNVGALAASSTFAVVLFWMSWRVFHLGMARIVERV